MNSAYYRSRKDPGKLSAVDAGDAEDIVRQIRLAGGLAQFICPSCGMPAIYVGPQNGNRARGSVSAYFRHIDQKKCEIPDCDLRVDLGMNYSAPLSQKLRLPLFLRPAAGGGFCLSAGFRTANKEALRLLRSQGYRRAVLKNSAKTLAKADLEEMEQTDSIYFVDLTEPVSAKEQYAVTLEGNDMTAPGSANPDWNNMLDGFGHASVGALFEYGAGGAGEKVPFGGFASADRPYLLAVKDSGSSSIKSFWQDCAETQLIPCKLAGGRLSAGFGAAYLGMKYDCSALTPNSPITPKTKLKGHGIDMSFGLYYTHPQFWGGLSLLHALTPEIDFGQLPSSSKPEDGEETSDMPSVNETSNEEIKQKVPRTFVAMGGTTIPLSRKIELMPSAMLRSGGGLTRVELTGRVRFLRILSLGVAWRNAEAATLLAGVEYRGFHAGYSYSYPLSRAWRDAGGHGRHEITAGYSVRLSASKTHNVNIHPLYQALSRQHIS